MKTYESADVQKTITYTPFAEQGYRALIVAQMCLVGFVLIWLTATIILTLFVFDFWLSWRIGAGGAALLVLIIALRYLLLANAQISVGMAIARMEMRTGLDLDHSGEVGDIRLLPVRTAQTVSLGNTQVDREDLSYFVNVAPNRGHTLREWEGTPLPSGVTCTRSAYNAMIEVAERAGALVGRTERQAGEWDHGQLGRLRETLSPADPVLHLRDGA